MIRGGFVPHWQRAIIVLTTTTVLTIVILVLYVARSILIPIALAIYCTFILAPAVSRLQHRGLGRTLSVSIVMLLAVLIGLGAGAVIIHQVVNLSKEITQPEHAEAFKNKIAEARESISRDGSNQFGRFIDDVTAILMPNPTHQREPLLVTMQPDSTVWFGRFESYFTPTVELLAQAAFTFILTVFMLLRREDLRNRMIRLTGHGKVTTTTRALDDASHRISRYLLAQIIVNASFGIAIAIGLQLIGLKLVVLWGAIGMLMRYVPYLGIWIALIPPTLFSLVMAAGWSQPAAVFLLFVVLDAICGNFVEPIIYGRSMGISEVAQLVAAAFWAFLWGPIGLILSGPLTVCLLVLGKHVNRFKTLDILLGDEPVLPPGVMFYQRLAARDQDEASQLAHKSLAESDPVGVFDNVILPALCLAKRDANDGDYSPDDLVEIIRTAKEIGEEVIAMSPVEVSKADHRVRVLLCPARDASDHVAVELLAATLDPGRWEADVAATEILASELLARIETLQPSAVIIGSLPPGEMAHTRYLVTRVRAKFPELKVIVGRWGRSIAFAEEAAEAESTGADWMDSTFAETQKRLADWRAIFSANAAGGNDHPRNPLPIGTPNASNPRAEGIEEHKITQHV